MSVAGPPRGARRARRGVVLAVLLAALLAVPVAVAQRGDVEVEMDLYHLVDTHRMTTDDPCGGTFTPDADGRGFLYEEGDAVGDGMVPTGGYGSSGCGFARTSFFRLPSGATSLQADFLADRRIDTFPSEPPGETRQGLRVRDLDTGRLVHQSEYFPADAGSREERRHSVGPVPLPSSLRNLSVEFYFEDQPPLGSDGGAAGTFLSGRDFSAHVRDIELVVRGDLARDVQVSRSDEREGTLLLDQVRVRMTVPDRLVGDDLAGFQAVPRVRAPQEFAFGSLRLPDGRVVEVAQTWNGSLDGDAVLLERGPDGLAVVVPPELVASGGPGTYELVLQATQSVRVSPALLPLAVLLLALPLPFAVLALVQARVFHREAFGAYRRAARYLMAGVAGMVAYYLFVVVSALVAGRLDLMAVWPLPLEGWLLYVQVVAAGASFVVLWLSARALYWITRPKPGAARRGRGGEPEEPEPDAEPALPPRPRRRPSDPEEPDAS